MKTVFVKSDENKSFQNNKRLPKNAIVFISNDEIIRFVNHLKDKITRTPDKNPSFLIKSTIYFIIFSNIVNI